MIPSIAAKKNNDIRNANAPRFFGKFASKAEAEKWIADHRWLTEQGKVADQTIRRDVPEDSRP